MLYAKIICLFFAFILTSANLNRGICKQFEVPMIDYVFQAGGIVGFIVMQWLI